MHNIDVLLFESVRRHMPETDGIAFTAEWVPQVDVLGSRGPRRFIQSIASRGEGEDRLRHSIRMEYKPSDTRLGRILQSMHRVHLNFYQKHDAERNEETANAV